MDKNGQRVACKNWNVYSPQRQNNLIFFWLPYSGLGKAVAGINPGSAMQWDTLAFLPHPTDITDIDLRYITEWRWISHFKANGLPKKACYWHNFCGTLFFWQKNTFTVTVLNLGFIFKQCSSLSMWSIMGYRWHADLVVGCWRTRNTRCSGF